MKTLIENFQRFLNEEDEIDVQPILDFYKNFKSARKSARKSRMSAAERNKLHTQAMEEWYRIMNSYGDKEQQEQAIELAKLQLGPERHKGKTLAQRKADDDQELAQQKKRDDEELVSRRKRMRKQGYNV